MNQLKRCVALYLIFSVFVASGFAQQAPAQQQQERQPGPGKKLVYTPFGPVEVDMSDPRPAIAVGPPLQPDPTPPPQIPAQPAPQPAAPQQPTAGATATQDDPIVPVNLRFDNQDIYGVIRIIADVLRINYVVDPAVQGRVTMTTAGDLHRSDLLPLLETILKINNATMVKVGNLYQVVPSNAAVKQPLQLQSAQLPTNPDDQIVLQVIAMKFVPADEMARLLMPYLSEGANIVAQGNILLVSDRRSNLRKLLEIVDLFDSRAFQGERVRMFTVKNSNVKDIVDDLKTVFSGYALSNNTAIRFLPMERLNSVLVITANPTVFDEVTRWIERLDQPLQTAGVRNFVYRAKNTKASEIQRVLTELYATSPPPAGTTTPPTPPQTVVPPPAAPATATTPPAPGAAPQTPSATPEVSSARLSGQLRIVADTINNALVIQATPQDYQLIERTIQELDVLPRQVLIDAQIYEVVLDHSLSLGLSAILQNRAVLPNPQTTASFTASGSAPAAISATTFAFIGRTRELISFLNASENRSRVRTLSAPSILVSNNATATVQIGAEIPIPTSSSVTPVQQGGTNLFAQTIQFRNTGVLLTVSPQINEGGTITVNVQQEVSQPGQNTTSAIVAPVIGKSAVTSTIVVQNGETIPLTGFIRENDQLTKNRVPLLGSIPVAGLLLGNTTKGTTRTELIVLITPHVVTTVDERAVAAEELRTKLKETQKLVP